MLQDGRSFNESHPAQFPPHRQHTNMVRAMFDFNSIASRKRSGSLEFCIEEREEDHFSSRMPVTRGIFPSIANLLARGGDLVVATIVNRSGSAHRAMACAW